MSRAEVGEESLVGHYAGPVTRLAAYAADAFLMVVSFGVILSVGVFVVNLLGRDDGAVVPESTSWVYIIGMVVWIFVYNAFCWALWWKTPGKSLLGLRVVERDGADLRVRTAVRRAFWWQACFLVPFSQIGVIIGRERRALHDVLAHTAVVYDWNARNARWRLLATERIRSDDGS